MHNARSEQRQRRKQPSPFTTAGLGFSSRKGAAVDLSALPPPAFSPTKYYFTCIFIALRLNTALTFFPPPPPTTLSPPVLPFSRAGGHDDDERGGGGGGKEGGRMQIHRVLSIKYSTQGDHVLSPPSIRLFIAISVT